MSLSIDEVARLHLAGELESYEEAVFGAPMSVRRGDVDDEKLELPCLDAPLIARLHDAGCDVLEAHLQRLRVHGDELEERVVIRSFSSSLRVR